MWGACSAVHAPADASFSEAGAVDAGASGDGQGNDQADQGDDGTRDVRAGEADAGDAGDAASPPGWRSLFNGVDFSGWDRYLGKPSAGEAPLGEENDPRGVYSVVTSDGEPAIHITGEVWGALISRDDFCHFDLRAQYKWGTAVWPPLNRLDSGIMYFSTGPLGAVNAGGTPLSDPIGSGGFMVSVEYQLAGGDIGGLYNLGPIGFLPGPRVVTDEQAGWNDVEIIVDGDGARHFLNGQQVASASQFIVSWPGQAPAELTCGKLQLQSESGEIYFRHVTVAPLP